MSHSKIAKAVKERQAEYLAPKKVDEKYYLTSQNPQDNLIEGVLNWLDWEDIEKDINEGKGNELNGRGRQKFLAVHSSSALCVNNFAPFRMHFAELSFLGYSGFIEAKFEKKQPTGLKQANGQDRTPPHLDFCLETKKTIIGIESKFTEYFGTKRPNHPRKHSDIAKCLKNNLEPYCNRTKLNYLPKGFHESIIEHYFCDDKPQHLDVAQLIKHTIGLLNNCGKKEAVLVYLYWEPFNSTIDNLFAEHRHNIEMFKHRIEHFIEFVPLSYPEFWKMYENDALLKDHFVKVKERYGRV